MARRRLARFTIAPITARSRSSAVAAEAGALSSTCRWALKNNSGSSRMRWRTKGEPSRQAAYSWPAWRVFQRRRAKACAIRSQSFRLMRATGTRYFMAMCAVILPSRTCCWMDSGRSSTSASRRDTQLTLRSNRRANSSSP